MLKQASWALALVSLFALSFHEARAQSDEKKFEAGGQFSLLRLPTRTGTEPTKLLPMRTIATSVIKLSISAFSCIIAPLFDPFPVNGSGVSAEL
jgi:hypothetical protein